MILVIDNYDSFTWNIVQYLAELGAEVEVCRNDLVSCDDISAMQPQAILLSPGPGVPDSAGITLQALQRFHASLPVFGVCLGHQSIGQFFGGHIVRAGEIMHGKLSPVYHDGSGVFRDLPNPITVTRYHSLVIDKQRLPAELALTAWTQNDDGEVQEIMGIRHAEFDIEGVQFHPESISSEHGHALLQNFLTRLNIRTEAAR